MINKKVSAALLAASMAFGASAAQAEPFTTMGAISAQPMSASQMKAVEGKQHIYFLVENRGVELPEQGEAATRFTAAPTPQDGRTGPSPSRQATAFDFLN